MWFWSDWVFVSFNWIQNEIYDVDNYDDDGGVQSHDI